MNFGSVCGTPWDEAYLVGGGSSLKGYDFGRLRGRTVVAINDAAIHVPFATALFSLDLTWISKRHDLINSFTGERYLAVPEDFQFEGAPSATYLLRSRTCQGLSFDPAIISAYSGNSGFGALNLAVLKGAKRIVLLGYDFCLAGQHWHDGYDWQCTSSAQDRMYFKWAQQLDFIHPQLQGIQVLNASPCSRLTAFKKIPLEVI